MLFNKNSFIVFLTSFVFLFSAAASASGVSSLFHHAGDPVSGNPRGTITIVEFFDYECPHCANMVSVMNNILNANPSVRLVYKELPLLGPESTLAARAALAANKQGAYVRFNQALYDSSGISEKTVYDIARNLGLNISQFRADMNGSSVTAQLNANASLAQSLGIPGTPAFFIGKTDAVSLGDVQSFSGELSKSEVQEAINRLK